MRDVVAALVLRHCDRDAEEEADLRHLRRPLCGEVPGPDGPFGAQGVRRLPVIAIAGSVANAVAAATGPVCIGCR